MVMKLKNIIERIVGNDLLHLKFLNTLSFMENCGARKISSFEDPWTVNTMVLKHAAEEHRHAYYLKKQLTKIVPGTAISFRPTHLIAPLESRFYLNRLDVLTSRYLKNELMVRGRDLAYAAYLFVTYAIELRADSLYPLYQQALTQAASRVTVKSIMLEEAGHLQEMLAQLSAFSPDWSTHAARIVAIENELFDKWLLGMQEEICQ